MSPADTLAHGALLLQGAANGRHEAMLDAIALLGTRVERAGEDDLLVRFAYAGTDRPLLETARVLPGFRLILDDVAAIAGGAPLDGFTIEQRVDAGTLLALIGGPAAVAGDGAPTPSDDPIELVARALYDCHRKPFMPSWSATSDVVRDWIRAQARAAIPVLLAWLDAKEPSP